MFTLRFEVGSGYRWWVVVMNDDGEDMMDGRDNCIS